MCLCLLGIPLSADNTEMIVSMADGSAGQTFALSDIGKITFGDSGFTVFTSDGGAAPFVFDAVRNIRFSELAAGIGTADADGNAARPYYRDGCLGIDGMAAGSRAKAAIYGMDGTTVAVIDNWDGTPIPTAGLTAGVYIFNVNNNSIKFVKQ